MQGMRKFNIYIYIYIFFLSFIITIIIFLNMKFDNYDNYY